MLQNGKNSNCAAGSLSREAEQLARLLPRVTRSLFAGEDEVAAKLPLAQLKVCGMLSEGPKSMSDLGSILGVSRSAMTQIADRLERTKLVKRGSDGTDRRVRCLKLTGLGEQFMRKRHATLVARVSNILQQLPPEALQPTLETFEALLRACETADGIARAEQRDSVAAESAVQRSVKNGAAKNGSAGNGSVSSGHATNGSKTGGAAAVSLAKSSLATRPPV